MKTSAWNLTTALFRPAGRWPLYLLPALLLAGCGAGDDPAQITSTANGSMPLENSLPLPAPGLPDAGVNDGAAGGTFPAGHVPTGLSDEELAVM